MSPGVLLLTLLVFAAPIETLGQALEVVAEGEPLGRVPGPVALEAVAAIRPDTEADDLEKLVQVAKAGGATRELRDALMRLVYDQGQATRAALVALQALPEDVLSAPGAPKAPPTLEPVLYQLALSEELTVAGMAFRLVVPLLGEDALVAAVEQADEGRARLFLRLAADTTAPPAAVVDRLLAADLRPGLGEATGELLRALVHREAKAADALLDRVSGGDLGFEACGLRAVGGVRLSDAARAERAASILQVYLAELTADLQAYPPGVVAATVTASTEQFLPDVLPLLPGVAQSGPGTAARVAAIRAIAQIGYRDAPTVDLLLTLLADKDTVVSSAAWLALRKKTSQDLPNRLERWKAWRERTDLPAAPKVEAEKRLEVQRRNRAEQELAEERKAAERKAAERKAAERRPPTRR